MKRNLMRMRANRLRIKGNALLLCVLVLFGLFAHSKAEAKEMIPTDYFSEFVFERLPIPTMFDASYEDLQKKIIPNDMGLVIFHDKIIDREMYIPTVMNELTIIKDIQKDQKKNKALLENKKGILLSELESRITKFIINNLTMLGGDPNKIVGYYELVSEVPVAFGETKLGMGDLDFNYLAKYATYTGDREDVAYSYEAVNWKFKDRISFLVENLVIDPKDIPYELLDKEITIEQFIKDVYLKILPYYYWPINVKKFVKEGIFIPEISEEKRNEKIFDNEEIPGTALVINTRDTIVKIILYQYNQEKNEYSDLYTNKKIPLTEVEAWISVKGEDCKFEEAYHVLGGYGNQVANKNQIFIPFRSSQTQGITEKPLILDNFKPYYELVKKINKDSTIGELVDAYQELPLEYTIDYTGYDFSNNPDIVNASESKSPQLVKTPGN